MNSLIKVIIADDHYIMLEGLKRIIEECPDMEVVGTALDGKEAIKIILEKKPDVAIVDISMPHYDGLEVVDMIKKHLPKLPILILTMHEEEQYVFRAIEIGAMGYITKKAVSTQLVDAIRKVHAGKRYLPEDVAEVIALKIAQGKNKSPIDLLSTRELQVLKRIALGQTNREIAEAYNLSVKTIDTYRQRILKKLKLRNNADISRFAISLKLI
ncbi:two component transcriptional regulator, LuxR family [Desulfonauticus submarinus]|uniref:Two component transcriptional regulator, LuxR family n=1 Tax=Desulfonauticus submarinus TaxID=206665 RepID=A0A1H0CIM4_9BACT|nr:response regulator transcription factor [Desulfonauticus submarinus]SDN57747.1 two component transcriptional regulator, LuxR family [Desulfonauticus submarinus]